MKNEQLCEHLRQIKTIIQPKDLVCEECIKTGDNWVHLRTCQTCGVTLCCDDPPNTHITKHYHATKSSGYNICTARRTMALVLQG